MGVMSPGLRKLFSFFLEVSLVMLSFLGVFFFGRLLRRRGFEPEQLRLFSFTAFYFNSSVV